MRRSCYIRATRRSRLSGLALLALGISACLGSPALAAHLSVTLPDRSTSLSILTVGRRTYLDARAVAALVSGKLQVDAPRGRASLRVGAQALTLHVGSATVRIAERVVSLSSSPRLLGRRFLAPLDLLPLVLAERYGQEAVEWKPEQRVARVRSRDATITQIRVGAYPTHTRVVLEMVGPRQWSIQKVEGSDALRVVLPGGVLAKNIQPLTLRAGVVRAVQPAQQVGGAEVRLVCEERDAGTGIRTFMLKHPDRIVIDILAGQPGGPDQRTVREDSRPPSGPSPPTARPGPPMEARPALPTMETSPRVTQASVDADASTSPPDRQQVTTRILPSANGNAGRSVGGPAPLTILLDPGHGGHDTGAVGPSGLMEKDVVLDLALRLRRLLTERLGIRVIMTRTEDVFVPLQERTAIANRARADFFLSLHVNAAPMRGAEGFETFYFTREPSDSDARASAQRENLAIESNGAAGKDLDSLLKITLADMAVTRDMRESGELAEIVLTSLEKLLKVENRGVKSGPFYVLATAAMPAILVEIAFITNPKEERELTQGPYRQRVAEALFTGIAKFKVRYERRAGMGKGAAAAAGS
jgi:N-acetylmuramoyl-L-alanine amidase